MNRKSVKAQIDRIVREEVRRILEAEAAAKPVSMETAQSVAQKLGLTNHSIEQLRRGMEVEQEHLGTIKNLAGKSDLEATALIAADHLKEYPDYYTRLKKVET